MKFRIARYFSNVLPCTRGACATWYPGVVSATKGKLGFVGLDWEGVVVGVRFN